MGALPGCRRAMHAGAPEDDREGGPGGRRASGLRHRDRLGVLHLRSVRQAVGDGEGREVKPSLDVSVIVVTFNGRDLVPACLESIPAGVETIVVDNGSKDGTPEEIASRFPGA